MWIGRNFAGHRTLCLAPMAPEDIDWASRPALGVLRRMDRVAGLPPIQISERSIAISVDEALEVIQRVTGRTFPWPAPRRRRVLESGYGIVMSTVAVVPSAKRAVSRSWVPAGKAFEGSPANT